MSDFPPQFDAEAPVAGAVTKDGSTVVIEFVAGDQRLWVTMPANALVPLSKLCAELDVLAIDAKNGVANQWHTKAGD